MARSTLKRTDPKRDARRLVLYFGGLIVVYAAAVAMFWGAEDKNGVFLLVMFAPTVGALLARFAGPGVIQWGRPTWWILAGLIPAAAALVAYSLGSLLGLDTVDAQTLVKALAASPLAILTASLSAAGEEIGWRGFLWPLLRRRRSFLFSSLVIAVIWWVYHVPLILLGWYGTRSGILAFTVAIVGITLLLGVITDRSRSVWPSILTHGVWNALVATGFAVTTASGDKLEAFTGGTTWVGEFGWLAALSVLVAGIVATVWHLRVPSSHRGPARSSLGDAAGNEG
ncbi:MAG TPA: CPBP family intramembrane glutamic endopeptidase [Thermoleophilia bacterium]|nr:CPBP family intramembrane glutamic endopeptidase [Thermoleophilia bacterium]